MTSRKPETALAAEAAPPLAGYVPGQHAASIRSAHNARRMELLARDEVLDAEIKAREAERHDINEALGLMSEPAPAKSALSVVPLAAQ